MANKKYLFIILLIIFFLFLFFRFKTPTPVAVNKSTPSPLPTSESSKIIKCQSVVVTPGKTTELFVYTSGRKVRADYRVGATTNEESFKTQFLYDGQWLYVWNPPNYFGQVPKPTNPPGQKMKLSDFKYNINITELGKVLRFGSSPLSGDYLCSEWDDVDPIFEIPSDFVFTENADIQPIVRQELDKICLPCGTVNICRQNLICL